MKNRNYLILLILVFSWGLRFYFAYANQKNKIKLVQAYTQRKINISGYLSKLPICYAQKCRLKLILTQPLALNGYHAMIYLHDLSKTQVQTLSKRIQNNQIEFNFKNIKLKPPSGIHTPGTIDAERQAFINNIQLQASAKWTADQQITQIENRNRAWLQLLPPWQWRRAWLQPPWQWYKFWLGHKSRFFDKLSTKLHASELALALILGDPGYLDLETKQIFNQTGLAHILASSGLHLALVVGLIWGLSYGLHAMVLLVFGAYNQKQLYSKKQRYSNLRRAASICALIGATYYLLLTGCSLASQRAYIMFVCMSLPMLGYYKLTRWQSYALAGLICLYLSPAAILSAGFGFSFLAVGLLLALNRITLLKTNVYLFLGLAGWSLFSIQQLSYLGLLVNLLCLPIITYISLPLLLFSSCCALISFNTIGCCLMQIANFSLILTEKLLAYLNHICALKHQMLCQQLDYRWQLLISCGLSLIWLWYCRERRSKVIIWLLVPNSLILLFYLLNASLVKPKLKHGQFQAEIIDVGQGLAVVIRTKTKLLLYDTGPKWPPAVLANYLRQPGYNDGYNSIDGIIISHGDSDHVGGLNAVLTNLPVSSEIKLLSSEPAIQTGFARCQQGQSWHWDGVNFAILHPNEKFWQRQQFKKKRLKQANEYSCILKITATDRTSLLLTGDIGKKTELQWLASVPKAARAATVLLMPHHGSKHSSSPELLQEVQPQFALVAAGRFNPYGHPSQEALLRYQHSQIPVYRTDSLGCIKVLFGK